MFARNTPTRMKGSAVVRGLKSLVSKLHPQLPLSSKESQRLLTALTTSFRKQLDQAHPSQPVSEDNKPTPLSHGLPKSGAKQLHSSSASFADKHLASVLTSPLLSKVGDTPKPDRDLELAKAELQSNPSKDPILLLEEYHQKGAATVPLALLCLEKVEQSLSTLPDYKREAAIREDNTGKRVLLWLWKSKLYEGDEFVENVKFIESLCRFLVREQADQYFWEWWKMDMALGNQELPAGWSQLHYAKMVQHSYRWKNRMLRNFVKAKFHGSEGPSPNSALQAFLHAVDVKESAVERGTSSVQYSLHGAWHVLVSGFQRHRSCLKNTDPQLYDRMLQGVDIVANTRVSRGETSGTEFLHAAILWLLHPLSPSPLPMLRFLRGVEASEYSSKEQIYRYMTAPRPESRRKGIYHGMVRTVVLLQEDARIEDANWMIDRIKEMYPDLVPYLDKDSKRERTLYAQLPRRKRSKVAHKLGSRADTNTDSFIRLDLGSL